MHISFFCQECPVCLCSCSCPSSGPAETSVSAQILKGLRYPQSANPRKPAETIVSAQILKGLRYPQSANPRKPAETIVSAQILKGLRYPQSANPRKPAETIYCICSPQAPSNRTKKVYIFCQFYENSLLLVSYCNKKSVAPATRMIIRPSWYKKHHGEPEPQSMFPPALQFSHLCPRRHSFLAPRGSGTSCCSRPLSQNKTTSIKTCHKHDCAHGQMWTPATTSTGAKPSTRGNGA